MAELMRKHPVRKFFGLIILYSVIIVGIFVVQFRSNSVISKSFGDLSYSLTSIQSENENAKLKNQVKVSYKGILISADEKNPVELFLDEEKSVPLELSAFTENENSVRFDFTHGISLEFFQTPAENSDSRLLISVSSAEEFFQISVPYKIMQNYSVDSLSASSLVLSSKSGLANLASHEISESRFFLSSAEPIAKYDRYNPSKKFTFQSVAGLTGTREATVKELFSKLRTSFAEKVRAAISAAKIDSLSEIDITSYVAELSSQGRYNQAIDSVPDSFKKGNRRTYVSSPYFASLVSMNRSLSIQNEKFSSIINSRSLDAFTSEGISDYILREKKSAAVKSFFSSVLSRSEFEPTPFQAAGIINVYCNLFEKDKILAENLAALIDQCVDVIQQKSFLAEEKLFVVPDGGEIDSVDTKNPEIYREVFVGNALNKLGKIRGDESLVQAGNLIMYSSLLDENIDLKTVSEVYPIIARDNYFIPHTEILGWYGNTCVWAWTIAKSITYTISPANTANIFIDFPLNLTHYVIFKGVPNFNGKIEIQNQMFRTDPNFETYNSSGYVYQANSATMFLKSRHKSRMELVRLFFTNSAQFETTADLSKIPELPKSLPREITNPSAPKKSAETKNSEIPEDAPKSSAENSDAENNSAE
jgi:hypothetical protein